MQIQNTEIHKTLLATAREHEVMNAAPIIVQNPEEFRDDFVLLAAKATDQVGLETMQFEITEDTRSIFDAIKNAADRGVNDVRFHYDRFARRHIRVGDSQAWAALGRTMVHQGDKPALKVAQAEREALIKVFETRGITSPSNKTHGNKPLMSHNHAKLAIVDDIAWFGSMNLRGRDFEMSNFMVKVTDPEWVTALKQIFNDTEQTGAMEDKVFRNQSDDTEMLLDAGGKGNSIIYDKALMMADSLQEGDEFIIISQWPPVKMMFGELLNKLDGKNQHGAQGTFLMSPSDVLHPSRRVSKMLQGSVDKKYASNPDIIVTNLARQTHAKIFFIKRANGKHEALFGSHNFTSRTVKNGTRELAMWSKDPAAVSQIAHFLDVVQSEVSRVSPREDA